MPGPHISLAAETVTHLFTLPISNSLISTWSLLLFLSVFSIWVSCHLKLIPHRLQSAVEWFLEALLGLFASLLGADLARKFLPLLGTFFIFIILSNWSGLLPGVGTIGIYPEPSEFIPLFRAPTADLNTTLALAVVSIMSIQAAGLKGLGLNYLKKFFNFSSPVDFFVGLLEIISEISRMISFTFRLFGNIFAGEVLLAVVAFLIPLFVPIPFLGMELFVGFIQALVFAMLTATFLNLAVTKVGH